VAQSLKYCSGLSFVAVCVLGECREERRQKLKDITGYCDELAVPHTPVQMVICFVQKHLVVNCGCI